jgi:hypothetical protein
MSERKLRPPKEPWMSWQVVPESLLQLDLTSMLESMEMVG